MRNASIRPVISLSIPHLQQRLNVNLKRRTRPRQLKLAQYRRVQHTQRTNGDISAADRIGRLGRREGRFERVDDGFERAGFGRCGFGGGGLCQVGRGDRGLGAEVDGGAASGQVGGVCSSVVLIGRNCSNAIDTSGRARVIQLKWRLDLCPLLGITTPESDPAQTNHLVFLTRPVSDQSLGNRIKNEEP